MQIRYTKLIRDPITLKEKPYKTYYAAGNTKVDCFKAIYESERGDRYCNDRRIQVEPDYDDSYREWKVHGVTAEMYYGSSTVD